MRNKIVPIEFINSIAKEVQKNCPDSNGWRLRSEIANKCETYIHPKVELLSARNLERLVSCKSWNRHPTWSYSDKNAQLVTSVIEAITAYLSNFPSTSLILRRKSEGIFAIKYFDSTSSLKEKRLMSKRIINSKDSRLRNRAIEYCSLSALKKRIKVENNSSLKLKMAEVIGKSGYSNGQSSLYTETKKSLVERKLSWSRRQYLASRIIDETTAEQVLSAILDYASEHNNGEGMAVDMFAGRHHHVELLCHNCISKISKQTLLNYINLTLIKFSSNQWTARYGNVSSVLKSRLESKWN